MSSTFGSVVLFVGLSVAFGALLLLANVSGLGTTDPDLLLTGVAVVGFLVGVFMFGWGLGKRTGY